MSPKWVVDPVRLKQIKIRKEYKRLYEERLERQNLKGFTKELLEELEKASDKKMIYYYRKELIEIYFTGKGTKQIPPGVRHRLRNIGIISRSGGLTHEGRELFKRKRWLPRKRYKSSED